MKRLFCPFELVFAKGGDLDSKKNQVRTGSVSDPVLFFGLCPLMSGGCGPTAALARILCQNRLGSFGYATR